MFETANQKSGELHGKIKTSNNSSMVQNYDEIKKLGKEMEAAKTGSELQKENLTSDPIQSKEETGGETVQEIIEALDEQLDSISGKLMEGITMAVKNDDQPTANMFMTIRTSLEKYRAMLKAHRVD